MDRGRTRPDALACMLKTSALAPAIFVVGCGSPGPLASAEHFPPDPLMTVTSNSGKFSVEVRTAPDQPPSRGAQSVEFVIRDASTNALQTGLSLQVLPWMPAMGHGSSVVPTIREASPGTYLL